MKLRLGFIGTGSFTGMHMGLLQNMEGVELASVCGSKPGSADSIAAKFGAKPYNHYMEMLENEKLDAVFICTPPYAHGPVEQELIERRIPFFVEKPIGLDPELMGQLEAAISATKLITSVGYHYRYLPSTEKAREIISGQKIGLVNGHWLGGMPMVSWWRANETSGGQLHEQTTHIIDLMRYICGEIVEVYAAYNLLEMHKIEGTNVPDVGAVTVKFQSGAVGTITNSCMINGYSYAGLQIYTTEGAVELKAGDVKHSTGVQEHFYRFDANPYIEELNSFLHAVRTGDTSRIRSSYADAYRTFRVTMACNESAKTGMPVRLM